jgi:hypothetical protein
MLSSAMLTRIFFITFLFAAFSLFWFSSDTSADGLTYVIVDTGQDKCYDEAGRVISSPPKGSKLHGQDAQYKGNQPAFKDNGDGTITDLNTGLIWQKTPPNQTYHWQQAMNYADTLVLAGKSDWRLPTIKELLSIADFNGSSRTKTPYIDTEYFDYYDPQEFGQNRPIDGQYWSSTKSVATTMRNDQSSFGFNFTDGRIKAYPRERLNGFVRCVRGNTSYAENNYKNNGDGTITDKATGLMWMKFDSGQTMDWSDALTYAKNLDYAGYDDWRLPNAKELQSLVDYSRAPDNPNSSKRTAAINPIFSLSETESWFWSSTTLLEAPDTAVYVAFGRGTAADGSNAHGSGCLRSDPKEGDPSDYAGGRGPQSDEIRIFNYVRCVRDADSSGDDDTVKPVDPKDETDLAVTGFRLNKVRFQPGDLLEMYVRIQNKGDSRSAKTTLTFYMSNKSKLDATAELLSTATVTPMNPDLVRWQRRTWRFPDDSSTGRRYLFVICDEGELLNETTTSNNIRKKSVTVL